MQGVDFWLAMFGVAATIVGGVWSAFVYFDKRAARPAPSKPRPKARSVASEGGVSTAGNLRVGGNLAVSQLPRVAVVVMLAGIALIAVAASTWAKWMLPPWSA